MAPHRRGHGKDVNHADLGKFEFDGLDWVRKTNVPEWASFVYRSGDKKAKAVEVELAFGVDDETETPSAAAIAVASRTLANASALSTQIVDALWNDFNGRGPKSGMWWSEALDEVGEGLEDADPPEKTDDLYGLMRPHLVRVCKSVERYRKPVAEIRCRAAFEESHAVGVLTDGDAILGLSYGADVTPFKKAKKRSS